MDTQIWLPIVTLVLGWGLGLGAEWSREVRLAKREREARRKDRQYGTIIEVQDVLRRFLRDKLAVSEKKAEHYNVAGRWELGEDSGIVRADSVELFDTLIRLTTLRTRIEDEELGRLLSDTLELILVLDEGPDKAASDKAREIAGYAVRDLNERARVVLAELH